jgi:hypothetical protein
MFGLVDALFGCAHRRYTFPMTTKKPGTLTPEGKHSTTTYIVCLDCGKEFPLRLAGNENGRASQECGLMQ